MYTNKTYQTYKKLSEAVSTDIFKPKSKEEVENDIKAKIESIKLDGTYDENGFFTSDGDVDLSSMDLGNDELKGLKLKEINGDLNLYNNNLTSCEGLENIIVHGTLYLKNNDMKNLKGLHNVVIDDEFDIRDNPLTSLEGMENVDVYRDINIRQLDSLSGAKNVKCSSVWLHGNLSRYKFTLEDVENAIQARRGVHYIYA